MKQKKFWASVGLVWMVLMFTDWLFHGVWLAPMYQETARFWRPMSEMEKMMPYMWLGQFIFSAAFVWVYSNGVSKANQWGQAFRFAWAILFLKNIPELMGMWATVSYPGNLVMAWLFISVVQAIACSFALTWVWFSRAAFLR